MFQQMCICKAVLGKNQHMAQFWACSFCKINVQMILGILFLKYWCLYL